MKLPFPLLLFLTCTTAGWAEPWFTPMVDGDRVEATERSTGCFHDATFYYEVKKANGAYSFTEYAISWDKATGKIVEKKSLGSLALNEKDLQGLELLLKFYRSHKEVSSTSRSSLFLEYFQKDQKVKVERLQDNSGGSGLQKLKDVIEFSDLSHRIKILGTELKPTKPEK